MTGRFDEASAVLDEAIGHAATAPAAAARATLVRSRSAAHGRGRVEPGHGRRGHHETIHVFEAAGDEAGLAMAWRLLAWAAGTACRFGDAAEASRNGRRARAPGGRPAPGAARGDGLRRSRLARADPCRRGDRPLRGSDGADGRRPPVGGPPPRRARRALRDAGRVRPRARHSGAERESIFEELGLQMETPASGWRHREPSSGSRADLDGAARELRRPMTPRRPWRDVRAVDRGRDSSRRRCSSRVRWTTRARSASEAAS